MIIKFLDLDKSILISVSTKKSDIDVTNTLAISQLLVVTRFFLFQKLKRVEKSHSTFITGLEFLPTNTETEAIRGFSDASVVSISVDNQVCIHHIPRLQKISMTFAAVLIMLFLIATFIICSYFGL